MTRLILLLAFILTSATTFAQEQDAASAAATTVGTPSENQNIVSIWKCYSVLMNEIIGMKSPVFNKIAIKKFVSNEISNTNDLQKSAQSSLKSIPVTLYKSGKQAEANSIITKIGTAKESVILKKLILQFEACINPLLFSKDWKENGKLTWISSIKE